MGDRARPWSKFYWSDWESDNALRQCSLAAQGLWMRMLCICAKGEPHGYLTIAGVHLDVAALATAVSKPETEVAPLVAELDRWGVFSRDRKGRIYSRRMIRDERKSNDGRKAKNDALSRGPQSTEKQGRNSEPSRGSASHPSPHKPETRKELTLEAGASRATVNPPDQPDQPDLLGQDPCPGQPQSQDPDASFGEWWQSAPRKVSKGAAAKAYRAALKLVTPAVLLAGIRRYAAQVAGTDPQYIAHPATWLRGQRWLDEPPPPPDQRPDGPAGRPKGVSIITGAMADMDPVEMMRFFDQQRSAGSA